MRAADAVIDQRMKTLVPFPMEPTSYTMCSEDMKPRCLSSRPTITCSSGFMITAGDFARLAQMPMADGYPATTSGTRTRTYVIWSGARDARAAIVASHGGDSNDEDQRKRKGVQTVRLHFALTRQVQDRALLVALLVKC